LQEGRENANIDAGLGFIWRISDNEIRLGISAPFTQMKLVIEAFNLSLKQNFLCRNLPRDYLVAARPSTH
jgi:hypothetical protein